MGLTPYRPDGTYFVTTDVSATGYPDGRAFCLDLPERAGVVAIPSQVFYDTDRTSGGDAGRQLVRWAFCKKQSVIDEAVNRLKAAAW